MTTHTATREHRRIYWTSLHDLGATKAEIGAAFGVSRERVRQVIGNTGHRPFSDIIAIMRVIRGSQVTTWNAVWRHFPSTSPKTIQRAVEAIGLRDVVERLFRMRARWMAHGTRAGYTTYGCRCAACVTGYRDAMEAFRDRVRDEGRVPHGTLGGFSNYGCKCPRCWDAKKAYERSEGVKAIKKRSKQRAARRGCPPDKHGTSSGYDYYRCRCQVCKAFVAARWQARKSR